MDQPTAACVTGLTRNSCLCAEDVDVRFAQEDQRKKYNVDANIIVEKWRLHKVQSPIELKHEESNECDHFEPLEFHGHWDVAGSGNLFNNGFTATLTFYDRELPVLKGGPLLNDNFVFEQLHFHWSDDDHSGCEHIFEGRAYSMEAHAVHYNQKYNSFKEAVDKHDGLAVVAFFLQATDDSKNELFEKMCEATKKIDKVNSKTQIPPDCLLWFKEQANCKGYYTYQGSLTTAPFCESVTWIIYPTPIAISREQVSTFRNLKSTPCEKTIVKNVRPIQIPEKNWIFIMYDRTGEAEIDRNVELRKKF
ncbi:carbonic anhydrase 2 [Agrilus planipennis]|uniref:Carbonic anhydrase 2 n=1 Tax=Agrilus planipennis TaxID=224129 RepID=A0A1W4XQD7_AGRPL|nr:carbonic anhydrase 2 [Agrilus planipennis]